MVVEFRQERVEATVEQYLYEFELIAAEHPEVLSEIGMKVACGAASPNLTAAWKQWMKR